MENYARTLLARQQALDHLDTARDLINRNQQEMNRLLAGACAAARMLQVCEYERALEKQQAERVAALALAERRTNAAFQAMLLARQQRLIVDGYRKKKLAGHQREVAREEQKFVDDLAARRAGSILSWNPAEAASQ